MKKIIFTILVGATIILSGCSKSRYMEARNISINDAEVFTLPVVARLQVDSLRHTWVVDVKKKDAMAMGLNVNNMRAYAMAVACRNGDVNAKPVFDAIVGATYVIRSSGKRYQLEITGFPAIYRSFEDLKREDLELINFSGQGNLVVPTTSQHCPHFNSSKK